MKATLMSLKNYFLLIFSLFLISGCATEKEEIPYVNLYEKFFRVSGLAKSVSNSFEIDETSGQKEPEFINLNISDLETNIEVYTAELLRNNYVPIGESGFQSTGMGKDMEGLRRQALKVGADIVWHVADYQRTNTSIVPYSVPSLSQTYLSTPSNPFAASAFSTGTQVTSMSVNIDVVNYYAYYWVKRKPTPMGVFLSETSQETRAKIGGNFGIQLDIVVKGGAFFNADFLDGDVLTEVNGTVIRTPDDVAIILKKTSAGTPIRFKVFRNGSFFEKDVVKPSYQ